MKQKNTGKFRVSRRNFLGTSAAVAAAISMVPITSQCATPIPPSATGIGIPNSTFGGVHIGTITYSYLAINPGIEGVLKACVDSGVSDIELMSNGIEIWCGAPTVVRAPWYQGQGGFGGGILPPGEAQGGTQGEAQGGAQGEAQGEAPGAMMDGMPGGLQQPQYTDEMYAELEKQAAESQEALKQWRLSAPLDKFTELGQMFRDQGVDIHIVKFEPSSWSDEEIDYAFEAAKRMGAMGISEEGSLETAQRLGSFAEKHGMYACMHNHMQYADPAFSCEPMLDASPAVMLNFDCGEYFGSTGKTPMNFIKQYHDRIFSLHLKDKTGPNTDPPNTNQVWGQGETLLAEVLLLLKEHAGEDGWPQYADIELEYPVAPWSNVVKETRTCVNYARQILI